MVGSLKMNTTLEYSTRVVQEGDRRCKKSTLNDLAYLTPLRIPLMNPVYHLLPYIAKVLSRDPQVTGGFTFSWPPSHSKFACGRLSLCYLLLSRMYVEI
jgi:hypothetical protein